MQEYIKKISGLVSNNNTILIISNNEIKKVVKIVEGLEDSSWLPGGVSETIQNEAKVKTLKIRLKI